MEIFFHHKASPFVRKVLLGVAELGLQPEERAVDFTSDGAMDDYARVNPNRRFPALRDGELVLWESNAIVRYLAARHGPRWLGATPAEAAHVDQWLSWELSHLGPTLLGLQNHRLGFLPRPHRDEASLLADRGKLFAVLDGALSGRGYVAGEAITVADLALASMFSFADEAGLLEGAPAGVRRWFDQVRARDSWQATERMKREALAAFGVTLPARPSAAQG
ncbi:MAG TPA: glutathione S-transferase family protein [Polyangiaceae bacterium]|nr:glutathione S-transferase family protein [Polyangiaceae bacterium]